MAGYDTVDPFNEIAGWLEDRFELAPGLAQITADHFVDEMYERGVVIFGYTQIPELMDDFKRLAQEVAWETYQDNLVA